jgi:putative hydrolase of the HAD superfamily
LWIDSDQNFCKNTFIITTLFFDFDGVLTTEFNGSGTICEHLSCSTNIPLEKIREAYKKYCTPLLIGGKFIGIWDDFCLSIGHKISNEDLQTALRTFSRNEAMFSLAADLRKKYTLGIITDNTEERMALIEEDQHVSDLFSPIILSASVHALKHDGTTTIFDAALNAAGCNAEEAIFIDNQERNLITPAKMGMHTYYHDDAKNDVQALMAALDEWGVRVS